MNMAGYQLHGRLNYMARRFIDLWLLYVLLITVPARAEISYQIGGGHYLIDVLVNGVQTFPFVVDTAAQTSSLYPLAIESLGLQPLPNSNTFVQGANGRIKADIYTVKSIAVSSQAMKNFQVAVIPDPFQFDGIGGILGMDFLARYAVEFDCSKQRLKLHHDGVALQRLKEQGMVVPLTVLSGGFLMFTAFIEDHSISFVLDTGARRNVIDWVIAEQLGLQPDNDRLQQDEPIIGAAGIASETALKFNPTNIRIGDAVFEDQMVTVADLEVLRLLQTMAGIDESIGILGSKVFSTKRFILDYFNSELVFLPSLDLEGNCKID